MGRKRVDDKRIVVNYNGELLQAQLQMQIMKYFIEEQERRQERGHREDTRLPDRDDIRDDMRVAEGDGIRNDTRAEGERN